MRHQATNAPPIRILLVDDNHAMRKATHRLLNFEPDFRIIGEADNGLDAVALVEQYQPEVVIMNYAMPKLDGVEATRRIRQIAPHTSVIILSSYDDPQVVDAAMDAGATSYFVKPVREIDKFYDAIRFVATIERDSTART